MCGFRQETLTFFMKIMRDIGHNHQLPCRQFCLLNHWLIRFPGSQCNFMILAQNIPVLLAICYHNNGWYYWCDISSCRTEGHAYPLSKHYWFKVIYLFTFLLLCCTIRPMESVWITLVNVVNVWIALGFPRITSLSWHSFLNSQCIAIPPVSYSLLIEGVNRINPYGSSYDI